MIKYSSLIICLCITWSCKKDLDIEIMESNPDIEIVGLDYIELKSPIDEIEFTFTTLLEWDSNLDTVVVSVYENGTDKIFEETTSQDQIHIGNILKRNALYTWTVESQSGVTYESATFNTGDYKFDKYGGTYDVIYDQEIYGGWVNNFNDTIIETSMDISFEEEIIHLKMGFNNDIISILPEVIEEESTYHHLKYIGPHNYRYLKLFYDCDSISYYMDVGGESGGVILNVYGTKQ